MGATGAGLFGAAFQGRASADGGDGGDGDGGDGGGSGSDRDDDNHYSVTLITGETIHVSERRVPAADDDADALPGKFGDEKSAVERTYAIEEDGGSFHVVEESDGTYLIPHGVDTDRLDRAFFNVDYLVEYGYDDEARGELPVVATFPDDRAVSGSDADAFGGTDARTYESVNAVAAEIPKERLRERDDASAASLTRGLDRLHLDRTYAASLDASAPRIGAPGAREVFDVDGDGVRIAVVDTGIDADHPDFGDRVVYEANFSDDDFVHDGNGHGTQVAGIAAGDGTASREDDDDVDAEYVGVAPGAYLMNVKALNFGGLGRMSDVMAAIEDAVENGADVINLSLGSPPFPDDPTDAVVDWARERGVIVVSSAGNEIGEADFFTVTSPATAAGAIAVGASDDDEHGGFTSARGPSEHSYRLKPEVSAPGVEIISTGSEDGFWGYPYADPLFGTGTSFAAPHVAGVAALLLDHDPDMGPDDVRNVVVSTAEALEDRDVYTHGSGEVDAHAALDRELVVHESVVDFGIVQEATEETRSVTVENVADEELSVDVSVTMRNEREGEGKDENARVEPEAFAIAPEETATVELTVDTEGTVGMNAGRITFETEDTTYATVFGFTRAIDVVLDKTLHEERDSALGDLAWAWTHDGDISQVDTAGFSADGIYNFPMFREEATFTAWSVGHLPGDEERNQPLDGDVVTTIASDVAVDEKHSTIELDENDTALRTVDTSDADDQPTYEAFHCQTTTIELYGFPEERDYVSYTGTWDGDFNIFRTYFTPLDEDDSTNVANAWLFYPRHDRDYRYDTEDVYWFYEPTTSLPAGGEEFSATESVASDTIDWRRDREDQLIRFAGHVAATDQENFPEGFRVAWLHVMHRARQHQTWHRTPEVAEYTESFRGAYDNGRVRNNWWASRKRPYVATDPGDYEFDYNRYPLTHGFLPEAELEIGPDRIYVEPSILDQRPIRIGYSGIDEHTGAWWVTHDGETIAEDPDPWDQPDVEVTDLPALEAGDEVGIHHRTADHTRDPDANVRADYVVTYDPDGPNRPPSLANVHVPRLSNYNRIPPGTTTIEVQAAPAQEDGDGYPEGIVSFDAYYAGGDVETTPFDDPEGWHEADVTDLGDGRYAVDVEATTPSLDLAFVVENDHGNVHRSNTLGALRTGLPITVKANSLNLRSNRRVAVDIEPNEGFDPAADVDRDSLRFGAPVAVDAGEGAKPVRYDTLGDGRLRVHFPVADTGYEADAEPAVAKLAGSVDLDRGETLAGADGLKKVTGTGD